MDTLIQGVNSAPQPGVDVPQPVSLEAPQSDDPYNPTFWDWLGSASGFNFYKNLFLGNPNGYGFWDFMGRDPETGYHSWDTYKNILFNGRAGDVSNDVAGIPDPTSYDGNALNDLPDELYDIYKQGLEMFANNKYDQQYYNSDEADKEREWARLMRQTAYQDTMLDLQKAGINPLVAFASGIGPTATPSGATASSSFANSNTLTSSMASSIMSDKKLASALITAIAGIFRIFTGSVTRSYKVK